MTAKNPRCDGTKEITEIFLAPFSGCISLFHSTGFSPDLLTFLPSSSSKEAQIGQSFFADLIVLSRRLFSISFSTVDLAVPNTLIRKGEIGAKNDSPIKTSSFNFSDRELEISSV